LQQDVKNNLWLLKGNFCLQDLASDVDTLDQKSMER
jgi:hypothetical protein